MVCQLILARFSSTSGVTMREQVGMDTNRGRWAFRLFPRHPRAGPESFLSVRHPGPYGR